MVFCDVFIAVECLMGTWHDTASVVAFSADIGTCANFVSPVPFHRFHERHGVNVHLLNERTTARRTSSFAHALTFSDRPLRPGELFLLQIGCTEAGWSGALRLGLTQQAPDRLTQLPTYALPDLTRDGHAWICAVSQAMTGAPGPLAGVNAPFDLQLLFPSAPFNSIATRLSTDRGSRVGVYYVSQPDTPLQGDMHIIVNGVDSGPQARNIPLDGETPLWAVVDVYGTTKEVCIVQLYGLPSLRVASERAVLRNCLRADLCRLPLPEKMKSQLWRRATAGRSASSDE